MSRRQDICEVKALENLPCNVSVAGWVRTVRRGKNILFIEINDGSCLENLQVVCDHRVNSFSEIATVKTGASLSVSGKLVMSPASGQRVELQGQIVHIYGRADATFPLQKKGHSMAFLRTMPHLRPRTNTFSALTRVRSALSQAVHRFFDQRRFVYLHTPIITANDCEGAGELFQVTTRKETEVAESPDSYEQDFFGKKTFLTVSGQLEGEAYATAVGKIYTFGPTFRAENSHTSHHLAEFWMIEPEASFYELGDVMNLAEDFLRFLCGELLSVCAEDLSFFDSRICPGVRERLEKIQETLICRVSYTEAVASIQEADTTFETALSWGMDLQKEHERYLTEVLYGAPVIVYDYPRELKPFYMKVNDDTKTVAAMDLLVPHVGELIGGAERESRLEVLVEQMARCKIDPKAYDWYLDLRRYGSVPHGGFGVGFDRLVQFVTGMKNIRDVIPFPRSAGSI
ncbi:asparagine--tRNA ligase [Chitinivibrio alkaliphilus]|uniref:Asparagine--tRNA ligase n=1 Tax=Chitinivibrio alkaliphilus ACht1 TaxID=1313304 RepID=U7DBB4_9BACT|nr:asparagine--tRNA ligase [Chitinivibrio alkaliphilus]ERP38848.1 asparaginyl-tRNA synthetase [Chitinivibrio alkaliphilus ACht1]